MKAFIVSAILLAKHQAAPWDPVICPAMVCSEDADKNILLDTNSL